jgi:tripartite-type tricarboxylate transporter receptor subunit TctC
VKVSAFARDKPIGLAEVSDWLDRLGEKAKPLAGGQSIVPALNTRLVAPRGTLQAIVDRLNPKLERLLRLPEIRTRFIQTGAEVDYSTPPELAERIRSEPVKWGEVARATGVRSE